MCYKNKSEICVNIQCDYAPVVWVNQMDSESQRTDPQNPLRLVAKICIKYDVVPWWDHIPGEENTVADNSSRFKPCLFTNDRVQPNHFSKNSSTDLR